jgi:predicted helicase
MAVDLIFKTKNGQTWAVQAKCYLTTYEITKSDVDKFLSETNRKGIDRRLLIATTDRLGNISTLEGAGRQDEKQHRTPTCRGKSIAFANLAFASSPAT